MKRVAAQLGDARRSAQELQGQLLRWLRIDAYPLWSRAGVDRRNGGFHERLDVDGRPLNEPRRARVQPRQCHAFALGPALGWAGPALQRVDGGLHFFLQHYRRPDGLYRALVSADGAPLDESALLYDQAFALLGFAAGRRLAGPGSGWEQEALALLAVLDRTLKRTGPGFDSGLPMRLPLLANPHMHLFEACLAWCELSVAPVWRRTADDIATLALTRLIDPVTGVVREIYDESWSPAPGIEGRMIEPGHLYEWAWLLLRWSVGRNAGARVAALKLIEVGERHALREGVVVDALLEDCSVPQCTARLWPQTERLKATAFAAALTGEGRYWQSATAAAQAMQRYFQTSVAGLWNDRMSPAGAVVTEPALASSFYHIVEAILALTQALASASQQQRTPA